MVMPEQPKTEEWRFPCRPSSVPEIRREVRGVLAAWGLEVLAGDAELCVSELAANAVVHGKKGGGRKIGLVVAVTGTGRLRIEVHDAWGGLPHIRRVGSDDENGRGLFLLAALAVDWGVEPRFEGQVPGKAVWFELGMPGGCGAARRPGPHVGVTETGDTEYPYRIDFAHLQADPWEAMLTTAQAMTLVSRLAPMLGLTLGPARRGRRGPGC